MTFNPTVTGIVLRSLGVVTFVCATFYDEVFNGNVNSTFDISLSILLVFWIVAGMIDAQRWAEIREHNRRKAREKYDLR